jgi:hypothetical protein
MKIKTEKTKIGVLSGILKKNGKVAKYKAEKQNF